MKRFIVKDLLVNILPTDELERRKILNCLLGTSAVAGTTITPVCCPQCSIISLTPFFTATPFCCDDDDCSIISLRPEGCPGPCSIISKDFDNPDRGYREVLKEQLERVLHDLDPMGPADKAVAYERGLKPKTKEEARQLKRHLQEAIAEIDDSIDDLPDTTT